MAKPNYSFEKKQRELAKKKKQDEERAKKQSSREAEHAEVPTAGSPQRQMCIRDMFEVITTT